MLVVWWVVRSILMVSQRLWYVLSCMWDDAYKRSLAAKSERVANVMVGVGFFSHYLSGPSLPYVRCYLTKLKMC